MENEIETIGAIGILYMYMPLNPAKQTQSFGPVPEIAGWTTAFSPLLWMVYFFGRCLVLRASKKAGEYIHHSRQPRYCARFSMHLGVVLWG